LPLHVGCAPHRFDARPVGEIKRILLAMRLAARRVGEGNALHDETTGAGRLRRCDQIAGALDADACVALIGRRDFFLIEAPRQVGDLVNDDVGLRLRRSPRQCGRIVYVDDGGANAGGFQFPRGFGRAGRAGDLMPGGNKKRHEPPSDGSGRAGKKNPHVDLPVIFSKSTTCESVALLTLARRGQI
jgi:hypothetical protein